MRRKLSIDQSPSLSVPLRFFLTAPIFAMAAGGLLIWVGPQALLSRWSPLTLALTHLLTLGFLTTSMAGAIFQILPVVVGVEIPRTGLTAAFTHGLLSVGAAVLSSAFWASVPALFEFALLILLAAAVLLAGAVSIGLWRVNSSSGTIRAMRMSMAAFVVTAGLGITLGSAFAWPSALPLMKLTDLHAAWGLLGWVGLLIIGVAYQVVPMFQLTEVYPPRLARGLAPGIFLLLCAWTAIASLPTRVPPWIPDALSILMAVGYGMFAATTLYLLWHRKRPKLDATALFWYTGLVSLLCGAALWLAGKLLPDLAEAPPFLLALGILFIVGTGYSVVNGMLYKIVPFLVWYHLQNQLGDRRAGVPNVRQIILESRAMGQFYAHALALSLLAASCLWPGPFTRLAAAAFVISSCWLWFNLLGAARTYRNRLELHAIR